MITLPLRSEQWTAVRVLVADRFGNVYDSGDGSSAGAGPWVEFPMQTATRAGLELMDGLTRVALPEIDKAILRMRFGVIDGKVVGLSADEVQSRTWDPASSLLTVPSLIGKEIRIQATEDDYTGDVLQWATVWWGRCEYESDSEWPAAIMPAGERTYTCMGGLFRTKQWFMTRHAAYVDGTEYNNAPGHPGYNVGQSGRTLGNRTIAVWNGDTLAADADNKFFRHTWQGNQDAVAWTDLQAVEHALRVMRPTGEPQFSMAGSTALFTTGASPWPVNEGESAFDVVQRICARERARGLVFVDWEDDADDPFAPLQVKLTVKPQTRGTITYLTDPITGTTGTINGAAADGTTVAVDLVGDHRAEPSGFTRANRGMSKYWAVETVGERIQTLVAASRFDGSSLSLEDRWSASDASAFIALDFTERIDERFRTVFQSYGLPRSWQGLAMDHNAGATVAQHRTDYRCNDLGAVVVPTGSVDTSPLLVKILPDTPLLEGYVYSGATPARRDGTAETGEPDRRPPCVWVRTAANRYLLGEDAGVSLQVKNDSILVWSPNDLSSGTRLISDTDDDLGADYDTDQLGLTLALELPHRLRFRTIRSDANQQGLGIKNTKRIEIPDAHLWLASPGAMWDVDGSSADGDGAPGVRGACGATVNAPGILRDDRARVAVLHALACAWYLSDHRPCTWTLRCCGLLPTFSIVSDGSNQIEPDATVAYPRLGQFVTTLAANGQTEIVDVPITGVVYNHQSGTTTWSADWIDLDVSRG